MISERDNERRERDVTNLKERDLKEGKYNEFLAIGLISNSFLFIFNLNLISTVGSILLESNGYI